MEAMYKGTKRNIESETDSKNVGSRVTDAELFTRLFYYGTAQLGFTPEGNHAPALWLAAGSVGVPQAVLGLAKPKRELTIDDVIPTGFE